MLLYHTCNQCDFQDICTTEEINVDGAPPCIYCGLDMINICEADLFIDDFVIEKDQII